MTKNIYLLDIGNYLPTVKRVTMPFIRLYALRTGAQIYTITDRKYKQWPVTYEKLQIYDIAREHPADWHIYIDIDTLIAPNCPDYTLYLQRNAVGFHSADRSWERFRVDEYFERDARFLAPGNWLMFAPRTCLDLWRPLVEMTPAEAVSRIIPTSAEIMAGMTAEHLIDDYALARNIARFGLNVNLLVDIDRKHGLVKKEGEGYLMHRYLMDENEKAEFLMQQVKAWGVEHYLEGSV